MLHCFIILVKYFVDFIAYLSPKNCLQKIHSFNFLHTYYSISKLCKRLWTNGADNGIWLGINHFKANMFSVLIWTSLKEFEEVWTSLDKFGQVWTSLDKFGQV